MDRRACLPAPLVHNPPLVAEQSRHSQGDRNQGTRREGLFVPGIDPVSGRERPIQIDFARLQSLPRLGLGRVKEAAYVLPAVLARPTAIFEGLTQESDESRRGVGWLCFVGCPSQSFKNDGTSVPARSGYVFLAFVNAEWVAYNWYWCEADALDPTLPDGHSDRFKKRLL